MGDEVVEASFMYFVWVANGIGVHDVTEQAVTVTVKLNVLQTSVYEAVLRHY